MSQGASHSFRPAGKRLNRTLVTAGIAAAILLIIVGIALAGILDGSRPARETVRQYIKDLSEGDASAALANAHPNLSRAEVQASAQSTKRWGELQGLDFDESTHLEGADRIGWIFNGIARFAHGRSRFDVRILQTAHAWKVEGLRFDGGAPGLPISDTESVPQENAKKQYDAPPKMAIDPSKTYIAVIDTTRGPITLDLFPKDAPKTVNNFVFLARAGFYDGLVFHRVIPDFMIQGGDPTATGSGGPGYKFEDETSPDVNTRKFQKGTLAMANAGPDTNGSQFFITHKPTEWLQGKHTVFGQVADARSQDVVNAIQQGDVMKTIKIEEKGAATQPATAPGN